MAIWRVGIIGAPCVWAVVLALGARPAAAAEVKPGGEEGTVSGRVTLEGPLDGPLVVYVEKIPSEGAPAGSAPATPNPTVTQKGTQFTPKSLVVTAGTSVDFP